MEPSRLDDVGSEPPANGRARAAAQAHRALVERRGTLADRVIRLRPRRANRGAEALAAGGGTRAWAEASRAEEAAGDYTRALAEIGLSTNAAWYAAAGLYGAGGLIIVVLGIVDHTLVPHGLFYLALLSIGIAALCLFAVKHLAHSEAVMRWTTHLRLITGQAIILVGLHIAGPKAVAYALFPLFTVLTPCYLCTWRLGLTYAAASTAVVCVMLLGIDDPNRIAHVVISTSAIGLIAVATIITKERTRRLARHNRELAFTDALTGIANMRSLRDHLASGLVSPADANRCALFAMDMDNFKQVNDRFDHGMGDRVLCAVAHAISAELDDGDLAARRGGDEFAVLARDADERDLAALCERLETAIARARAQTCPAVTPTGTVAYVRTQAGEEIAALMERADHALHDAKAARRAAAPVLREAPHLDDAPAPAATPSDGGRTRGLAALARELARGNPDWTFAALLFALTAAALAGLSAARLVEPLDVTRGAALAAANAALAAACLLAAARRAPARLLALPWALGLALLAVQTALAGRAGAALLDLIPAFAMYGFLIFRARLAALYMVLADVMYGVFAIGGGYPEGAGRTVITCVVVAVVGGLVLRLRLVTVRFARRNLELSELDALTGLANVRALRARALDVVERAAGAGLHPVVVAVDLDDFKCVNDTHSHSTGDRMLIAVGRALAERVRGEDLVARRGGDEFVIVMNDADAEHVPVLVERLGEAVARTRARICPQLTASASVAAVAWHTGQDAEALLHEADVALHARKLEAHGARRYQSAEPLHGAA